MIKGLYKLLKDDRSLEDLLAAAQPVVARILERALSGRELSVDDGVRLLQAEGDDLSALVRTADAVRAEAVGNVVTYVINRNINFTNICFVGCQFCAFARHRKDSDAYSRSDDEVLARIEEAVDRGATEICMQGGINPEMDPFAYRDLLLKITDRFPQVHIHAYSPMEIMYGARRTGMNHRDYLTMLRDAGLGTIPGTAAEILDDEVREVLSHKKVDVKTWIDIVTTAHRLGIRSSSTVMYAHLESPEHIARHTALIRSIQKETGGFTEFVPLRFIHTFTPLYMNGIIGEPPPKGAVDLRMYAFSRLMLRGWIENVQTSWVKLGTELAQVSLAAGCNDFGGTLMEESISREAGADAGEFVSEEEIRALIEAAGRIPLQRTTTYGRIPERNGAHSTDSGSGRGSGRSAISAGTVLTI